MINLADQANHYSGNIPFKKHIKYADNARSVTFTKKCKYYVRFSKCYAKNYASIINKSLIAVGRGGEGRGSERTGEC